MCIGEEKIATQDQWNPKKMSETRRKGEALLENVRKV
jgi:hypothetical protein